MEDVIRSVTIQQAVINVSAVKDTFPPMTTEPAKVSTIYYYLYYEVLYIIR